MSLLSKLLGGKKPSVSDVLDLLQGKGEEAQEKPAQEQYQHSVSQYAPPAEEEQLEPTPIGRSWGERMPDEPNQYNYPGDYKAYFEDIFATDFADCTVSCEPNPLSSRAMSYTFCKEGAKVLVVELMSGKCDMYKIRNLCRREGTPYLRFYYDVDGWWNARSYVVNRMRNAMKA